MPSSQFETTATVAVKLRKGPGKGADALYSGHGLGGITPTADGPKNLKTALAVQKLAQKWHHKVSPSKRLKRHANRSVVKERQAGEALDEAVGLVDASVAHQRRIRNLFNELETRQKMREEMDSDEEEEVHPIVQAAWHESRTQELRVSKKMNELRDDDGFQDGILPVRTIQQLQSYMLSGVAVLKSYMTMGVRVSVAEIQALMSQITFAANTTEALSRWAGEILETLGSERDRAQALHRENARVSREATMAQKEILGLEAKVFHAKKDVEAARADAARLTAESGDMRIVTSAIKDTILAAGLTFETRDEHGQHMSASQASSNMIKMLRETCVEQQDRIGRLEFFVEKGKLELEQAEMTIKLMAQTASSKRARKRQAAAGKAKNKGSGPVGSASGGSRGARRSPPTPSNRAAAASIAVTAAVSISPPSSTLSGRGVGTPGAVGDTTGGGPPTGRTSTSYTTASGGNTNDAASISSSGGGSTATALDSSSRWGARASSRGDAAAAADRDPAAASVSGSTAVDSYDDSLMNNFPKVGGGGQRGRTTTRTDALHGGGISSPRGRRRTQNAVAGEAEGAAGRGAVGESGGGGNTRGGRSRIISPSLTATTNPPGRSRGSIVSTLPTGSPRPASTAAGAGQSGGDARHPTLLEEPNDDCADAETKQQQQQQQQQQQGGQQEQRHPVPSASATAAADPGKGAKRAEGEKEKEKREGGGGGSDDGGCGGGGGADRTGGGKDPPDGAPQEKTQATKVMDTIAPGMEQEFGTGGQKGREERPESASDVRSTRRELRDGEERTTEEKEGDGGPRKTNGGDMVTSSPVREGEGKEEEDGEEGEEEEEVEEEDGRSEEEALEQGSVAAVAAPTVEKVNRHTSAAVKGLEDAVKARLGAVPGVDTVVKDKLSTVLHEQVALLKKTILRDMQEVAEEVSAAAAAEKLGMTTELAKRDTRITQLGSRIEDLQARLVSINEAHGAELRSLNDLASEGRKRRLELAEEEMSSRGGGSSVGFASLTSPQQQQQQHEGSLFVVAAGERVDSGAPGSIMPSTIHGEEDHYYSGGGGGGGGSSREAGAGGGAGGGREGRGKRRAEGGEHEHHGRHSVHPSQQNHQHPSGSPPPPPRTAAHQGKQATTSVTAMGSPAGRKPSRGRSGGGGLTAHFADTVGGRPGSAGVRSAPLTRAPVDGGGGTDTHWEASAGIGLLRRGKSAGTFFLEKHQQQQPQHDHRENVGQRQRLQGSKPGLGPGRGHGGTGEADRAAPGAGSGEEGQRAGDAGGRSPSTRESGGDLSWSHFEGASPRGGKCQVDENGCIGGPRHSGEDDQQDLSAMTAVTPLTQDTPAGTIPPPVTQQQQTAAGRGEERNRNNGQPRQLSEEAGRGSAGRRGPDNLPRATGGGLSAPASNGSRTPPHQAPSQCSPSANGVEVGAKRGWGHGAHSTTISSNNDLSPPGRGQGGSDHGQGRGSGGDFSNIAQLNEAAAAAAAKPTAPATVSDVQGRPRLPHAPKTVCDVVVAAASGEGESATKPRDKGPANGTEPAAVRESPETRAEAVNGDGGTGLQEGTGPENSAGDGPDGEAESKKHQMQQRALRAFLQGADETQANLAFAALRQEPFLVEEFDYLAKQIRALHEAMNGAVPRHVSHSELRERLRELSSRSAPLLRRVRARYLRLHARWASKLLEALSSRGLNAGDADVSLTCSLCGYDWRTAQPRGHRRRPGFFPGMKRGNTPGRVRGAQRRGYQQQAGGHAGTGGNAPGGGGSLSKREMAQWQRMSTPVAQSASSAVVVPAVVSDWKENTNDGSTLRVAGASGGGAGGGGGNGRQETAAGPAGPSLLSEEALFLHSLSAPTIGGVGVGLLGGIDGGGDASGVSSSKSLSVFLNAEGGAEEPREESPPPEKIAVALPRLVKSTTSVT